MLFFKFELWKAGSYIFTQVHTACSSVSKFEIGVAYLATSLHITKGNLGLLHLGQSREAIGKTNRETERPRMLTCRRSQKWEANYRHSIYFYVD